MKLLADSQQRGFSAELLVAYRFLEAGRPPLLPLVPMRYDLIVDGGDQFFRVQVRCAATRIAKGAATYAYHCHLTKNRRTAIPITAFDYLAVVVDANRVYLIPVGALHCAHAPGRLVKRLEIAEHGTRFSAYLNQFGLGPGATAAPVPLVPLPTMQRTFWHVGDGKRKAHRRLTAADIQAIQQLPVALTKAEEGAGRVPAAQVAAQFGVHVATLRNLLRGKRQDLTEGVVPG